MAENPREIVGVGETEKDGGKHQPRSDREEQVVVTAPGKGDRRQGKLGRCSKGRLHRFSRAS